MSSNVKTFGVANLKVLIDRDRMSARVIWYIFVACVSLRNGIVTLELFIKLIWNFVIVDEHVAAPRTRSLLRKVDVYNVLCDRPFVKRWCSNCFRRVRDDGNALLRSNFVKRLAPEVIHCWRGHSVLQIALLAFPMSMHTLLGLFTIWFSHGISCDVTSSTIPPASNFSICVLTFPWKQRVFILFNEYL